MPEISCLKINNMALNGAFSVEYLLHKELLGETPRMQQLMKDGIELCSMIEKGENIRDYGSELEIWEFMQILKGFFSPDELKNITKEAKEIRLTILNILNGSICIKKEGVRKIQDFFNLVGDPFLRVELSRLKRGCIV